MQSFLFLDAKWYPTLFDPESPIDFLRSVSFWATIALALAAALLIGFSKAEARKKAARGCLIGGVCYACLLGIAFLVLTFTEDGIVPILFYPLLALVVAVLACAILLFSGVTKAKLIGCGALLSAAVIAVYVCMSVYYASGDAEDFNGAEISLPENIALYLCTAVLIAILMLVAFLGDRGHTGWTAKSIAYAGICIAMSFALSYIRIVKLPQGGSITVASLLPLLIYAYLFGARKGVFAGLVYGLLQAIQDPYIIHPAQFLLDYPVAFACVGLAGLFSRGTGMAQLRFAGGALLASVFRFASHVFSGVFAFSEYAGETNPWIYSLGYNSFVFIDIAIVIVIGVLVFSSKAFVQAVETNR